MGRSLYCALAEDGFVSLFGSLDLRKYPHHIIRLHLANYEDALQAACELFCLGREVRLSRLSSHLRQSVIKLVPSGIARIKGDSITIAPLTLYVMQGLIYFAEIPNPLITVYFGEDSLGLASRLGLFGPIKGRVLDLCSGPGIQGILLASAGNDVTAVEINPVAASIGECNAVLNACIDRYETVLQSTTDFLMENQHRRFEKIVANPPLVPVPDNCPFHFIGAGGVDGLDLIRPIVSFGSQLLSPRGELITIGVSGGDECGPYVLDTVDKIAASGKYGCTLSILWHDAISPKSNWVSTIAQSQSLYSLRGRKMDVTDILDSYLAANISRVYAFSLRIVALCNEGKDEELSKSRLRVLDFSSSNHGATTWWVS